MNKNIKVLVGVCIVIVVFLVWGNVPNVFQSDPEGGNSSVLRQPPKPVGELSQSPQTNEPQLPIVGELGPLALFDGWSNPLCIMVFTGRQMGYVEPCGCTGLDHQKGGLARRHTFLQGLTDRGWPVAAIDIGNQVRRFGRQPELKFNLTAQLLELMEYQAVAFGPNDLKLPAGELFAVSAVDQQGKSMFVSANAAVLDRSVLPRLNIIELGGKTIGVTSLLADEWTAQNFSEDLVLESVEYGLQQTLQEVKKADCDINVLLIHDSLSDSRILAKKFPQFDFVVSAGSGGEPPHEMETVQGGTTRFVEVGVKGMYASVVGLFTDPTGTLSFRYQRVPLDSTYKDSQQVLSYFKQYQEELQRAGFSGLGIKPQSHQSGHTFVGSQTCSECHQEAFDIWSNSAHAQATESLITPPERSEITRQYDPECLSCHTTGWQPHEYTPFSSGFESMRATQHLAGSGCENCHGPGSEHVRLERLELLDDMADAGELLNARQALQLSIAMAKKQQCTTCHDLDNSPDFHDEGAFEKYWDQIKH
jgi:hypothetical protein